MSNLFIATDYNQTFLTREFETTILDLNDDFQKHTFTDTISTTNTENDSPTNAPTTSSWQLFVQCFVLVMGIIGTVGNAFIIFVIAGTKGSPKKSLNVLILNQLSVDMYSCVCLVLTYAYKLRHVYLRPSTVSVVVCMLLDSEMLLWCGLNSSPVSLFFIAAERYAKIVHPLLHRQYFRSWMTYVGIAITWINGILLTAPVTVITTMITGGRCDAYLNWPDAGNQISFAVFYFLWDFLGPSLMFVYCYWHIAIVIRSRGKGPPHFIKNEHSDTTARTRKNVMTTARPQIAGIQTVVTIASLFIVCWLPNQIYFLLMNLNYYGLSQLTDAWYGTLAFAFITICVHPYIYAGKMDGLWKYSLGLIRRTRTVHPIRDVNEYPHRTVSIIALNHLNYNARL